MAVPNSIVKQTSRAECYRLGTHCPQIEDAMHRCTFVAFQQKPGSMKIYTFHCYLLCHRVSALAMVTHVLVRI
jgi:hypothetical protein